LFVAHGFNLAKVGSIANHNFNSLSVIAPSDAQARLATVAVRKHLRRETVPRMTSTLKGLNHLRANGDATPLGLNLFWVSQPRVARAAQPWAD
jgi:hypothetical protein